MHNWSLVWFTLLAQGSVGVVWLSVMGAWIGGAREPGSLLWPMSLALVLSGLGIIGATAHLAKPRLAPNALRNFRQSWLSREVFLVQAFAGMQLLLVLFELWGVQTLFWACGVVACLIGGLALFAMTRVYLLRTVPVWNTMATPLEFVGSTLLLGGGFIALLTVLIPQDHSNREPFLLVAVISIGLGLLLKLTSIIPAIKALTPAKSQTWYPAKSQSNNTGWVLAARTLFSLLGLSSMILLLVQEVGPLWLWAGLGLAFFTACEVLGRWRFYMIYRRVGL
ncbi:MAG: dimethyl sulfoxide reductase anchor subunit [Desulfarculaceae bacterium]|nr:dimethyl sulfoxide reductase anchor subunit [Desulfarculaceae bacterium]MCF8073179.1 dimethyl sulfoxide reductase anchor subunit [Desulfarculaceae bacterium]MCF8100775.1 dimethyl sulfoxide reductase anchor subunit [Desulfarculaceae bacterium]MCF8118422.1 dimethyl sulfoxide reductase anchor subunit [Desulfarculaceae bacterium]